MPHSSSAMTPELQRSLEAVLRRQLTAAEQHFIHVLILKPQGARDAVDAITRVDEIDLANAMRLVAHFVSRGVAPRLHATTTDAMRRAPRPGGDLGAAIRAEQALEADLTAALREARDAVGEATDDATLPWLLESLEARAHHASWLARAVEIEPPEGPPGVLPNDEMAAANVWFLQLLIVIEQGLVHAFVQRGAGHHGAADAAWTLSAAAMKYATSMTTVLGRRRLAPRPGDAPPVSSILLSRLRLSPDDAAASDRALAAHCATMANQAAGALSATDLGRVAHDCGALFAGLAEARPLAAGVGGAIDEPLPCTAFDRVVETFVWPHERRATGGRPIVSARLGQMR